MSKPHRWNPGILFDDYPMAWCQCGEWKQVLPSEFKRLFSKSFRKFRSEYRKTHYLGKGIWKVDTLPKLGECNDRHAS